MIVGNGGFKDVQGKYPGLTSLSELTRAIHEGKAFAIGTEGEIAASSSVYLLGKSGDKQIHFDEFIADFSQGNIRISLYEDTIVSADGTPVIPSNMNFASTNEATLSVFSAPTITSNGTLKQPPKFLPLTGGGANVSPSQGGIAKGRVLKRNTNYLIRIENLDANTAVTFGAILTWHESDVVLP